MKIVTKLHKVMIFDEIRGHLLILLFFKALKKALKFEVEVLDTPKFDRLCQI